MFPLYWYLSMVLSIKCSTKWSVSVLVVTLLHLKKIVQKFTPSTWIIQCKYCKWEGSSYPIVDWSGVPLIVRNAHKRSDRCPERGQLSYKMSSHWLKNTIRCLVCWFHIPTLLSLSQYQLNLAPSLISITSHSCLNHPPLPNMKDSLLSPLLKKKSFMGPEVLKSWHWPTAN